MEVPAIKLDISLLEHSQLDCCFVLISEYVRCSCFSVFLLKLRHDCLAFCWRGARLFIFYVNLRSLFAFLLTWSHFNSYYNKVIKMKQLWEWASKFNYGAVLRTRRLKGACTLRLANTEHAITSFVLSYIKYRIKIWLKWSGRSWDFSISLSKLNKLWWKV